MPISAGDVTLTFLGDTTQLQQAFDRVSQQAKTTADTTKQGFSGFNDVVDQQYEAWDGLSPRIRQAGDQLSDTLDTGKVNIREAQGEVMLLGDLFGIHLPRHVSRFIATLPLVGAAMESAFAATAVIFIVEALIKGIEKISQIAHEAEQLSIAWNGVQRAFQDTDAKIQKGIDEQQEKILKLSDGSVAALAYQLQHMGDAGAAAFASIKKEIDDAQQALAKGAHFWNFAGVAAEDLKKFGNDLDQVMVKAAVSAETHAVEFAKFFDVIKSDPTGPLAVQTNSLIKGIDAADEKITGLTKHIGDLKAAGDVKGSMLTTEQEELAVVERVKQQLQERVVLRGKELEAGQKQLEADRKSEANKAAEQQIKDAKEVMDAQIAAAERSAAAAKLAYDTNKINARALAEAEIKATDDTRKAREDYASRVVAIYKSVGNAVKATAAEHELETQRVKDHTKDLQEQDKVIQELRKAQTELDTENRKFAQLAAAAFKDTNKGMQDFANEMLKAKEVNPFPPLVKNVIDLDNALRRIGVTGVMPLRQQLDAAMKAEAALNKAGIHDGKIWLEVQAAKLKAIIAVQQAEGRSTRQEEHDLQQIENQLKKFSIQTKATQKSMKDMTDAMKADVGQFALDVGDAFAAVREGQESFSQAMEQSVGKLIGNMAKQWAQYFEAMAIADLFFNPARAAAELAAAVALETVAGVAGSLGGSGGGSSSSSGSSSGHPNLLDNSPATQPQAGGQIGANVPRLAAGALVTAPTLAIVGDSPSGGRGREAILPLDDHNAMREIAAAMHGQGHGHTKVYVQGLISPDNLTKVIKKIDRQVQKRQGRLTAGNSFRLTRRS